MNEDQYWQATAWPVSGGVLTVTLRFKSQGSVQSDALRAQQICLNALSNMRFTRKSEPRQVDEPEEFGEQIAAKDDWTCWIQPGESK